MPPSISAHAQTQHVTLDGNRIAYRSMGTGQPMLLLDSMRAAATLLEAEI
ncbi:hypothetical protein [Neoroseomonas lacus]|nr:hypothetical protein [Neoroseomonas lacus]